jgi:hypothetical protein
MFRSSQNAQKLNPETEAAKASIESLISEGMTISESRWGISIVRKRGTEHAFLVVEGKKNSTYVMFRTDLFLVQNLSRINFFGNSSDSVVNYFWDISEQLRGQAFIRLKELSIGELESLADASEYQSWGITLEQVDHLLKRLLIEAGKLYPYNITGNSSVGSSSTSQSNTHNCVSWCAQILKEVLAIDISNSWALIQRPSAVVRNAIEQAKASNVNSSLASVPAANPKH